MTVIVCDNDPFTRTAPPSSARTLKTVTVAVLHRCRPRLRVAFTLTNNDGKTTTGATSASRLPRGPAPRPPARRPADDASPTPTRPRRTTVPTATIQTPARCRAPPSGSGGDVDLRPLRPLRVARAHRRGLAGGPRVRPCPAFLPLDVDRRARRHADLRLGAQRRGQGRLVRQRLQPGRVVRPLRRRLGGSGGRDARGPLPPRAAGSCSSRSG